MNARVNVENMAGHKQLEVNDAQYQKLDPNGGVRDVTLPDVENTGLTFTIHNIGGETITVKKPGGATVATLPTLEACTFICDGSAWQHLGIITVQAA